MHGKCSIGFLVVVLLIFLAVGVIFFPIFARPHCDGGGKSTCQNNLKQCVQALKMYCDDYNGRLPSSYLAGHSKTWNTPDSVSFTSRAGTLPPANARATWPQILYDNMKAKDVMFCPSDPVDKTHSSALTSYWYKLAIDKAWYGVGCAKPRQSMNDYAFESDQVAFYEHLGWHFDDMKGLRNGSQINASFMDTHVETIVVPNATSGDPINCAANSDGEPMYYNYRDGAKTADPGPAKHTDPTLYSDWL